MAEQYIIGNNAQFNDSVEILKDLTLYGVVENTTDFAVKIQGDEKLRITSEGALIGDTISHIGDTDTKIRFPENDVISFETAGSEGLRIESTGRAKFKGGEGQISAIRVESVEGGMALGIGNFRGVTGTGDTTRLGVGKDNNILIFTNASGSQVDAFAIGNTDPIPLVFSTSNTERLRITSSGILVKGHTESAGQIETQLNQQNQFHGNDRRGGIRIADFSNSQFPASLQFVKSRNATIGNNTILQDGDHMGSIYWGGANGTNYQPGAFLTARTDGTVSSTLMPTALSFGTNEGNNLVERLRIDPDGRATFYGTNAQDIIHISTGNLSSSTFGNIRGDNKAGIRIRGGGSYGGGMIELAGGLRDTDPAVIKFHTGTDVTANNDEHMRITSTGRVLINTTSSINSQAYLEVQGGTTHGSTNYIQTWKGDSDNIAIRNHVGGDYEFTNSQQGNQVSLYDGTGGARLEYSDNGNFIGMNNNIAFSNRIDALTTSGGSNVRVASGGELRKQSSSRRFKDNIREYIGVGVSAIKQIVPKLWEDHAGEGTKLGFIAEEIHDLGLTNAVIYDPYIGGSEIGIGITYGDSYGNGSTPVTKTGETLDDEVLVVGGLDEMSLIAELVIAIKQLTARIETLESGG